MPNPHARRFQYWFAIILCALMSVSRLSPAAPVIGEQAPPLDAEEVVQGVEGTSYSLADLRGKVVVLDFWFTTCGPCIRAMPRMNQLAKALAEEPVQFLGVTFNTKEEVASFLEDHPIAFPILIDTAEKIIGAYAIKSYPTVAVISPEGRFLGFTDSDRLSVESIKEIAVGGSGADFLSPKNAPEAMKPDEGGEFLFELLVAKSEDEPNEMSASNSSMTIDGVSLRRVIAQTILNRHESHVVSDLELDFPIDVTLRVKGDAPRPGYSAFFTYKKVLAAALEQTFSLRIEETEREIPCLLVRFPNGRPPEFTAPTSEHIDIMKDEFGYKIGHFRQDLLVNMLEYRLKRPVAWVGEPLEPFAALLRCDSSDSDSVVAAMKDQWGLHLEDGTHVLPVAVVTREDWVTE